MAVWPTIYGIGIGNFRSIVFDIAWYIVHQVLLNSIQYLLFMTHTHICICVCVCLFAKLSILFLTDNEEKNL